ncbi:hypothetical protein NE237_011515 [Protea cynaroides]|uniref:TF-B3 domain-containing protein n=1 Tax=Protea cynaroides TaxID=273540 RepID=A0A9Q0GZ97_9MAGN|nr:hypothetical protein NE237_011515 [Protea cynaroides]
MEFSALGRDGQQQYEEEEEMGGDLATNPMFSSCSSSSSSLSPSSNYSQYHKGLVPQPNVRWGSQSYDKQRKQQQRVWLGTFESEEEGSRSNEADAGAVQQEQHPSFSQSLDLMDLSSHQTQSSNSDADAGDAGGAGGAGGGPSGPGSSSSSFIEREHMFDKVVTPSDVGKLNRLVIPKQHAEKYFPLDPTSNDKGLLLNFEDRNGKPWRFRYSYWNSSQSYVMTKGWSRFVKEKKLDAGDIVSFERGVGDLGKDRLYIDWRHRPDAHDPSSSLHPLGLPLRHPFSMAPPPPVPWTRMFMPNPTQILPNHMHFHHHLNYDRTIRDHHHHHHHLLQPHHNASNYSNCYSYSYSGGGAGGGAGSGGRSYGGYNYNMLNPGSGSDSVFYLGSPPSVGPQQLGVGVVQEGVDGDVPMVIRSVPVVHGKAAAAKRVRLFGVNLECPTPDYDPDSEYDMLSSTPLPNTTLMPSSLSPHRLPSSSSLPPLELRVYGGGSIPPPPAELPRNAKQSFSFNFDI